MASGTNRGCTPSWLLTWGSVLCHSEPQGDGNLLLSEALPHCPSQTDPAFPRFEPLAGGETWGEGLDDHMSHEGFWVGVNRLGQALSTLWETGLYSDTGVSSVALTSDSNSSEFLGLFQ